MTTSVKLTANPLSLGIHALSIELYSRWGFVYWRCQW